MSRGIRSRSCCSSPTAARASASSAPETSAPCSSRLPTTPIHVHGTAGVAYLGSGTYQATYTLDAGGLAVVTLQWQSVLPSGRSPDSPHSEDLLVTLQMDRVNDVRRYGAELPIQSGEHFIGLMERVVDAGTTPGLDGPIETALDLRGQEATMFVTAPVALYSPFYLASTGYGLFVEGNLAGRVRPGQASDDLVSLAFEGPALRLHLIPGPDPRTILDRYTQLAGRPIVPPSWVFLPWRWRDENRNLGTFYDGTPAMVPYNSQLVEDVLMYQALDIPLGTMWIDRPWAIGPRGYDDFTWDTSRLPNPPGMIQWLRSRNIKLLLWIAPWVQGRMAEDAERLNYLMPDLAYQGDLPHVDFTNPAATAWWQGYLTRLVDQGIAGFKMDRADERVPYDSAHQTFDGRSTREVRNDYPRLYAGAASQALASTTRHAISSCCHARRTPGVRRSRRSGAATCRRRCGACAMRSSRHSAPPSWASRPGAVTSAATRGRSIAR